METYLPHYTYDDFIHWEGRWELIEGIPIAINSTREPRHQLISLAVIFALQKSIKNCGNISCRPYLPIGYKISDDTIFQPDALIVCEKIDKPFLDFTPNLVVEVISPFTAILDRNYKFKAYEKQGVKYYLIVGTKTKRIEINKLVNGNYETHVYENPYEFELTDGCHILADFTDVWE